MALAAVHYWLTPKPLLQNLRVLKNGNLRIGTVLSFIIPLYTQITLGWTAEQAGMLMVPAVLMIKTGKGKKADLAAAAAAH